MIDVSTLPPELWMAVFTKLDRPCDHASVALTCTTFRDLGFRLLYRRLVWRIEEMTNIHSHLETWNRNSHMVAVPVEATIRKHDPWGHGSAQYQKIVDRLGTFTNLKTLNFIDTTLPQRLHSVIHNFPCLRELRIRNCLLDRKAVNERTVLMQHHRLPIQELEIGKITQTRPLNQQNPIDDIYWLVTAQDLRSLRLVWHPESTSSWRHVFPVVRPRPSPTLLEKLSVEFVIQIQEGERDPERITRASEELHHASLPLIEFAAPLAHLKRLELDSSLDFFNIPTENGVFPALKEVRCPLYAADAFSRICNLTEIDLVRGRPELSSIMGRLDQFSVSQTNLTSLGVSLQDYEEEVLLGVSIMFRQLETLKITFVRREPSEQALLSMGGVYLVEFKKLHTFRLYLQRPPHNPRAAESIAQTRVILEASPDAVRAWARYCPSLREVQFSEGKIWRKHDARDSWSERTFDWVDGARVMSS